MERSLPHDDTVSRAKGIRHISGKIQFLLDEDQRIPAGFSDLAKLLHDKLHIGIRAVFHLIAVKGRDRALAAPLEHTFQLMFCQGMRGTPFGGCSAFCILEILFQPG